LLLRLRQRHRRDRCELLWQNLGPVRSANGLDRALAAIANDPTLNASWRGELARALLTAARQRGHSIGAHYRADAADTVQHGG